jgi:hypothetical protein
MSSSVILIAERLAKDIWNSQLLAQLRQELMASEDAPALRHIASKYYPEPNVAIPILERAVALDANDADSMVRIAEMYALHGDEVPAREWASRALSLDASNIAALYALSQAHSGPAREAYADRILLLDPHHYEAIRDKVAALLQRNDRDSANSVASAYTAWLKAQTNTSRSSLRAAEVLLRHTMDS